MWVCQPEYLKQFVTYADTSAIRNTVGCRCKQLPCNDTQDAEVREFKFSLKMLPGTKKS